MAADLNARTMRRRRLGCQLLDLALRAFPAADRPAMTAALKRGIDELFADHVVRMDLPAHIPTKEG